MHEAVKEGYGGGGGLRRGSSFGQEISGGAWICKEERVREWEGLV